MRSKWLALAAAAAASVPTATQAQALRWNHPETFRQAMVEAGYEADMFSSDQGTTRINAHRRGARGSFNIDFLPCEGDDRADDCHAAYFSLPYVLDSVPALKAAWNRSRGRPEDRAIAYGEDGYTDPVSIAMEMEVEIPEAGLARADFLARLRSWQAMVEIFERMMAQTPAAVAPGTTATP
jgi:hypothetical protein